MQRLACQVDGPSARSAADFRQKISRAPEGEGRLPHGLLQPAQKARLGANEDSKKKELLKTPARKLKSWPVCRCRTRPSASFSHDWQRCRRALRRSRTTRRLGDLPPLQLPPAGGEPGRKRRGRPRQIDQQLDGLLKTGRRRCSTTWTIPPPRKASSCCRRQNGSGQRLPQGKKLPEKISNDLVQGCSRRCRV
jgi:hypothetical protein